MPGSDLKNLGILLCLLMGMKAHLSEYEQGGDRRTLMNLTTFCLVS